jgi:hypothetical protein
LIFLPFNNVTSQNRSFYIEYRQVIFIHLLLGVQSNNISPLPYTLLKSP